MAEDTIPVVTSTPTPDSDPSAQPIGTPAPAAEMTINPTEAATIAAPVQAGALERSSMAHNTVARNEAQQPIATPPPPPHARLLAMISGLATGLGAFATSAATQGREGGVKEVVQVQGEEQRQRLAARESAIAQKNQQIQQQLTVADTNHKLAQNILLMAILPDEVSQKHMQTAALEQSVQTGKVALAQATNEFVSQWGYNPISGTNPTGATQNAAGATKATQQYIDFAADPRVLGPDHPAVKTATEALIAAQKTGDVNAIIGAQAGLRRAIGYHQQEVEMGIKQQQQAENAPFGDKANALNAALQRRYQVLNPGKPLPPELAVSPNSIPKDFDRVDKIMQQTENAQATKANRDIVNGMRDEMMKLAKGADIPGDDTKTGDEYIASLPVGVAATIKAIHEGREAPPTAGSRSAAAQTILGALNHAYPEYDATKYPSYLDARKKFTSGPEGKGINALNTVETHLQRMYDHATSAFTSGGITGKVTGFFGDKDVRALDIDRTAVATELSKAYAAVQISEGEIRDWEEKLDFTKPGMTTGKLITNLKEIDALLEGKQKAYAQQWSTASPSSTIVSPVPIISQEAAAARAKIRGESGGHEIVIGNDHYVYNGSGDTADLKNYTKK